VFYRKNVGGIERVVRMLAGLSLVVCGFALFGRAPLAWVSALSGLFTMGTGVLGFCPACAVAGRRAVEREQG
jgi:hypothetical protein